MNSKLRKILEELSSESSSHNWQETDYDMLVAEAEKAIRQAVGEEMLELIGSDATFTDIYGDDYRNNYGYSETQVRDAARWLQGRLRQKIKQWSQS